ncbi:MAG: type II toxin-antitoxin system HicA family toxin [Acidobacteriaceae bacterium]
MVLRALKRIGWREDPNDKKGSSHTQLVRPNFPDYTWSFAGSDEIGPKMMSRIAKHTGLKPKDL